MVFRKVCWLGDGLHLQRSGSFLQCPALQLVTWSRYDKYLADPLIFYAMYKLVMASAIPKAWNSYRTMCGGGSRIGAGRFRSYLEPPGAVGAWYGSGCFHFSSKSSASLNTALCCLGSRMFLFASNNDRMYNAWPLQRFRWTHQSRESLRERR